MRGAFCCRPALFVVTVSMAAIGGRSAIADLWAVSTDAVYSRVIRFDNNGNELPGGIASGLGGLVAPSGIAIDANERIYVSSRGNESNTPKILIYSCDDMGNCATETLPGGTPGVFAEFTPAEAAQPAQLRFGPDGNLYVSELFGTRVRVYDPSDGTRLTDAATNLPGSGGIMFDPGGVLLVGSVVVPEDPPNVPFTIPAMISRFSSGQQLAPFFIDMAGDLQYPASLLQLPNGDILAVDLFKQQDEIVRFSSTGELLGTFATIPDILPGAPNFPSDIVFDPDGNLIVSVLGPTNPDQGNNGALLRYDLDGNLLQTIASELEQIGGLAWSPSPETMVGDYDGNGLVEETDYLEWKSDYGKSVAPGNGSDGNADGIVDAADYTVWRNNLPAATGGGQISGSLPVPEPTTAALLSLGLTIAYGMRRKKKRTRFRTGG